VPVDVAAVAARLEAGPRPLRLAGRVQFYSWGGFDYLRELAGAAVPEGTPAAEWWLGAHPVAPAVASIEDASCPLDALIAARPRLLLGEAVARRFGGRLPFLFKVLDVRQMLSIQAHPSREQAVRGFAREQAAGPGLHAPTRTYRDDNHKPEAQVALTSFWLLHGFRPAREIAATFSAVPELAPLGAAAPGDAPPPGSPEEPPWVRALYRHIMEMPQRDVDRLLDPLVRRLAPLYEEGRLPRSGPDFWAARAAAQFARPGGARDRGILSIYLMNLVCLAPGEGTFIGPGVLHAYLEGRAVEVMASSDNVLRGGLTAKHTDIGELLRILSFVPEGPRRLARTSIAPGWDRYDAPVEEFVLDRLEMKPPHRIEEAAGDGPQLLAVIEGEAALDTAAGTLSLDRGAGVYVPPGLSWRLESAARAVVFRVSVPDPARRPSERAWPTTSAEGLPSVR
jgi:mannose-6-phosphate isomerase